MKKNIAEAITVDYNFVKIAPFYKRWPKRSLNFFHIPTTGLFIEGVTINLVVSVSGLKEAEAIGEWFQESLRSDWILMGIGSEDEWKQ